MDKIPALFVAAISSLTFIAYKHPNAYRKMFIGLLTFYALLYTFGAAWTISSYFTVEAILSYIEVNKLKEAKDVANSYLIPSWMILAGTGLYFYLFALTFLPKLLDEDKPENK